MAPSTSDSWACRKPQLSALRGLLWSSSGRCIFACGSSSTGKRTIVNEAIDGTGKQRIEVDCVIQHTERLLFSAICGRAISGDVNELVRELNANMNMNMNNRDIDKDIDGDTDGDTEAEPGLAGGVVVVLNRAERLVSGRTPINFSSLTALLSLPRRVANFSLIFISRLPWPRYRDAAGLDCSPPASVHFTSYTSKQLSGALALMYSRPTEALLRNISAHTADTLYPAFVAMLTDLLSTVTTDLRELHAISREIFPRYLAPLQAKNNAPKGEHVPLALFNTVTAELRTVLKSMHHREYIVQNGRIVPRIDTSSVAANTGKRNMNININMNVKKVRILVPDEEESDWDEMNALNDEHTQVDEDLSEIARFLIVSAFLAARNPPKHDMRYFTSERTRRPYKRAKRKKNNSNININSTSHSFSVERLMAIFEALREANRDVVDLEENCGCSLGTAGLVQITNLIRLGYLVCDSSGDPLADRKIKSAVMQPLAEALARSLRIELHHYMHVE